MANPPEELRELADINRRIAELLRPEVEAFQKWLNSLKGKEFGSLEANQEVARAIQDTADRLGVEICCPKPGCGEPSIIRATAAGRTKHGVFQFYHANESGRTITHVGMTLLPELKVTESGVKIVRRRGKETFVEKLGRGDGSVDLPS